MTSASFALILPLRLAPAPVAMAGVRDHCWTLTVQFEKPAENRIDGYRERQNGTLGALGLALNVMALRNATCARPSSPTSRPRTSLSISHVSLLRLGYPVLVTEAVAERERRAPYGPMSKHPDSSLH